MHTCERNRTWVVVAIFCVSFVTGCWRETVVGTSDASTRKPSPRAAPSDSSALAKPKHTTTIVPSPGEAIGAHHPILGDIDGDGFDDFLIDTSNPEDLPVPGGVRIAYLFYGKPELPERLSTADADARFEAESAEEAPIALGDVNGDDLADFAIGHDSGGSLEFIFGSRTRHAGLHAAKSSGWLWQGPPLPSPYSRTVPSLELSSSVGDVNCDGIDDLAVVTNHVATPEEYPIAGAFGLVTTTSLILGGLELPNGTFEPSWTAASFGYAPGPVGPSVAHGQIVPPDKYPLAPIAAGDLDGDGCGDLVAAGSIRSYVYYGSENRFQGKLDATHADAVLTFAVEAGVLQSVGDLDGDGAGDLVLAESTGTEFGILFGPATRWSGDVDIASFTSIGFADKRHLPFGLEAGDIDGDTLPEIVITAGGIIGEGVTIDDPNAYNDLAIGVMYAIRGTEQRLGGRHTLTESEIIRRGPAVTTRAEIPFIGANEPFGASFSMAGDIDGDGGHDIIAAASNEGEWGTVYLIPSTPRAPD